MATQTPGTPGLASSCSPYSALVESIVKTTVRSPGTGTSTAAATAGPPPPPEGTGGEGARTAAVAAAVAGARGLGSTAGPAVAVAVAVAEDRPLMVDTMAASSSRTDDRCAIASRHVRSIWDRACRCSWLSVPMLMAVAIAAAPESEAVSLPVALPVVERGAGGERGASAAKKPCAARIGAPAPLACSSAAVPCAAAAGVAAARVRGAGAGAGAGAVVGVGAGVPKSSHSTGVAGTATKVSPWMNVSRSWASRWAASHAGCAAGMAAAGGVAMPPALVLPVLHMAACFNRF